MVMNGIDGILPIGYDKQMHFLFFMVLSFILGIILLVRTDSSVSVLSLRLLWVTLVLIGTVEEYRQYFLPDRSTEFLDAVANLAGVSCGLLLPFLIAYLRMAIHSKKITSPTTHLIEWMIFLPFFYGLWKMNEIPF